MKRFASSLFGQVIAAWEGDIDRAQAHRALNGEVTTDTAEILEAPVAEPRIA